MFNHAQLIYEVQEWSEESLESFNAWFVEHGFVLSSDALKEFQEEAKNLVTVYLVGAMSEKKYLVEYLIATGKSYSFHLSSEVWHNILMNFVRWQEKHEVDRNLNYIGSLFGIIVDPYLEWAKARYMDEASYFIAQSNEKFMIIDGATQIIHPGTGSFMIFPSNDGVHILSDRNDENFKLTLNGIMINPPF